MAGVVHGGDFRESAAGPGTVRAAERTAARFGKAPQGAL